ncbi:MAG: ABC transporter ATP-binding protein [Treponema sp.]|jgi:spermidine/putrescine transport system ATP-binding protein|nr:ABC transporter ATP-binding protein [Treponema sp.]
MDSSTGSGQEVLRLEKICKKFGDVQVLRGLELSVNVGEFITLLGASGCGKTTTLRIISGLEAADSGRVFLDGKDVTGLEPDKRDVNMVFQNYALFPHMNVEANIGYGLRLKGRSKPGVKAAVAEALDMVRLSGYERRMPSQLSVGQRQRIAVVRSLVTRPRVLLLDEPLSALDLQLRRQMQTELKRLQKRLGITFIYITHDQEEALTMSDRIAVMRDGIFEQIGSAADIYDRPRTSFVAQFVGNANILRGRAVSLGNAGDGMKLLIFETSAGQACLECRAPAIPVPGEFVTVAVRSEYVNFEPAGRETAPLCLRAQVSEKIFAGGQLRITARLLGGGEITASRLGIDSPLQIGQHVTVTWSAPSQAVLVDVPPALSPESPL